MVETMLSNIYQEREVLNKILAEFEKNNSILIDSIAKLNLNRILILATGSSINSAIATKYFLEKTLNVIVNIEEPFNYYNYEKIDKSIDLVIGISQSGKSTSTIKAMEYIKLHTDVKSIILTSDPISTATKYSDYVLDLNIEIEKVGFVTKGFTATLLNIILFSLYIAKRKNKITANKFMENTTLILNIINYIPLIISKTEEYFERNKDSFEKCKRFICIGYGPSLGIAKEFETKFTETVRYPSQGFELEAYMHGPYLEANKEHCIFYLSSRGKMDERLDNLREYMDKYIGFSTMIGFGSDEERNLIFDIDGLNEDLLVLLMVVPIQLLSYRIATLKGVNLEVRIFDDFDKVLKSKI